MRWSQAGGLRWGAWGFERCPHRRTGGKALERLWEAKAAEHALRELRFRVSSLESSFFGNGYVSKGGASKHIGFPCFPFDQAERGTVKQKHKSDSCEGGLGM